jgi:hypothetical protein
MYFFLIFGLPIGFLLLVLREYPRNEFSATRKAFLRGIVAFIPIWFIARIFGAIVPAVYGSFLHAFHEWADRILPYSVLPAFAYLVFYRPGERLPPGASPRRLTAFYAGALAPVGLCETTRIWGNPDPYALLLLPFFLGSLCLAMPKAASIAYECFGFGLAKAIAAFIVLTLVISLCPFLLLVRLWPLALLLVAAAGAGAWFFTYAELHIRPPVVQE